MFVIFLRTCSFFSNLLETKRKSRKKTEKHFIPIHLKIRPVQQAAAASFSGKTGVCLSIVLNTFRQFPASTLLAQTQRSACIFS